MTRALLPGCLAGAFLLVSSAPAATKDAQAEIRRLRERVTQLEQRIAELEKQLASRRPGQTAEQRRAKRLAAARQRMARDREKYTQDQLQQIESLYQVANKQWRTPQARQSLAKLIDKYPDANRTGCAVLYLGQMSHGDERVKYLQTAIEKFGDCRYGNGVQVGAYARYLLAHEYRQHKKNDEADALLAQLRQDYPEAVDHRGRLLSAAAKP